MLDNIFWQEFLHLRNLKLVSLNFLLVQKKIDIESDPFLHVVIFTNFKVFLQIPDSLEF